MPSPDRRSALAALECRLEEDGLLRRDPRDGALRTTRRFQGAMMRAIARVMASGGAERWPDDVRVPVASALLELYEDASNATLASLVAIMLPITTGENRRSNDAQSARDP